MPKFKIDTNKRAVRLFISSTFRDMQNERDEMLLVFKDLEIFCKTLETDLIPIDLRWGITEEEAQGNMAIEICLDEVAQCSPFFIGIIGERYGWEPTKIPPQTLEKYPWLREELGKSITEFEILLGAVRSKNPYSIIYRKNSEAEGPDREKIEKLMQRVKTAGVRIREYQEPKHLAMLILDDLKTLFGQVFPAQTELNENERENRQHYLYARNNAQNYIDVHDQHQRLTNLMRESDQIIHVQGEAGSGKSMLLSTLATSRGRPENTFYHFANASREAADLLNMISRFLKWLQRFGLRPEINMEPEDLLSSFPAWLEMAAAQGQKIHIIIDGLDFLRSSKGLTNLAWLPDALPRNVSMLISSSRALDELPSESCQLFRVENLDEQKIREITTSYLGQFRKNLNRDSITKISQSLNCQNPFFLLSMLGELRDYGYHDDLPNKIDEYLQCKNIRELIENILERYRKQFSSEHFKMLKEILILLSISRNGLMESEMKHLLKDPQPYTWVTIFSVVRSLCTLNITTLNYKNDAIRSAIDQFFHEADKTEYATRLSEFFREHASVQRKTTELPALYVEFKQPEYLFEFLSNPQNIKTLYENEPWQTKHYWALLEKQGFLLEEPLEEKLSDGSLNSADELLAAANLLLETGNSQLAHDCFDMLLKHSKPDDIDLRQKALGGRGKTLHQLGEPQNALLDYEEQEKFCQQNHDHKGRIKAIGNQGLALQHLGKTASAVAKVELAAKLAEEHHYLDAQQKLLGHTGNIYLEQKDFEQARAAYLRQETICKKLGSLSGLRAVYGCLGQLEIVQNNHSSALQYYAKEEEICREIGDKNGLQISIGNQANLYYHKGEPNSAAALYEKKLQISLEIRNRSSILNAHKGLALCQLQQEKPDIQILLNYKQCARQYRNIDVLLNSMLYLCEGYRKIGQSHEREQVIAEALCIAELYGMKDYGRKFITLRKKE